MFHLGLIDTVVNVTIAIIWGYQALHGEIFCNHPLLNYILGVLGTVRIMEKSTSFDYPDLSLSLLTLPPAVELGSAVEG